MREYRKKQVNTMVSGIKLREYGLGSICYIIGVLKSIRKQLNKCDGDVIHVVIEPAADKGD